MRIGDVAHQTGLNTSTIRYYENIGLVPPPARSPNGYRDYGPEAVQRLLFVRDAQESGLSLSEVRSILELRRQGQSTCRHVIALMERHLDEIDQRIERLRVSRELYTRLIDRAERLDPADCTDPDRCQTIMALPGPVERTMEQAWPDDGHGPGESRAT